MNKIMSWILGIIVVLVVAYVAYSFGADTQTPISDNQDEVVIKDGWKEFVSTRFGFAFQYPLEIDLPDGDGRVTLSVKEGRRSDFDSEITPIIYADGVKWWDFQKKTKPANQKVLEFLQAEHDASCPDGDCPGLGRFASKTNPKDFTEVVVLWLGHIYTPDSIYEAVESIRFLN